jgi:hypothetical protein
MEYKGILNSPHGDECGRGTQKEKVVISKEGTAG